MIDQTHSLARDGSLREQEKKKFKGCSRSSFEAIRSLETDEVQRELGPYMGKFEIKALTMGRDALVKLINSEIKKQGKGEVLFNYSAPPPGLIIKYDD